MTRQTNIMDFKKLTQEPSAQIRGMLAGKIAADFRTSQFTPSESAIAIDIFRILLRDAEIHIRQSMATELAHSPNAPHDIILALAGDVLPVSLPVLEYSQVLTEDDLITIVRSNREAARHCAIARRETLSQELSHALLETGNTLVLQNLFGNKGAVLNESNLLPLWSRIPFTEPLLEQLVARGGLPLTIVDKLYHATSETLRAQLAARYPSHSPIITKAAGDAREWELLGLAPQAAQENRDEYELVEDLIDELYYSGRLTHSLVMRALCVGNISVFECGMARLAEVPRVNARLLMLESSGRGFKALYKAAAMPEGFYDAVRMLLKISLEETAFGRTRRNDFRQRVIDRIYMGHYHRTVENMEYLLSIIGGKQPSASHVH
ncbi:MAG: DUF2336 domain-containing protein [Proteobacteria bacterium]|nr:DUF2336 domain-containing protein [Pseudomonadota bacterium]